MKTNSFTKLLGGLILFSIFSHFAIAADLMEEDSLGKIKYGQTQKVIMELLGKPAAKGKDTHWEATGDWVQEWKYPAQDITLQMASAKENGTKTVFMIVAGPDCKLATARGIKIGSTLAEVRRAYGNVEDKENRDKGSFIAGSIYGGVIFTLKNDRVTEIMIGAAAE